MVRQEAAQKKSSAVSIGSPREDVARTFVRAGLLAGTARVRSNAGAVYRAAPAVRRSTGVAQRPLQAYLPGTHRRPLDSAGPGPAWLPRIGLIGRAAPLTLTAAGTAAAGTARTAGALAGAALAGATALVRAAVGGAAPGTPDSPPADWLWPTGGAGPRWRRPSAAARARPSAAACPRGCAARGSRSAPARRRSRPSPARGPAARWGRRALLLGRGQLAGPEVQQRDRRLSDHVGRRDAAQFRFVGGPQLLLGGLAGGWPAAGPSAALIPSPPPCRSAWSPPPRPRRPPRGWPRTRSCAAGAGLR